MDGSLGKILFQFEWFSIYTNGIILFFSDELFFPQYSISIKNLWEIGLKHLYFFEAF